MPFCQGLSNEVRTHLIFIDRIAAGTSGPYLASLSKMRNRGAVSYASDRDDCILAAAFAGKRIFRLESLRTWRQEHEQAEFGIPFRAADRDHCPDGAARGRAG